MLPTVADLLGFDVIRRGSPQVVAGAGGLGARVRWVHVLELADAAHLLQGGELVLTTGVALPAEPALLGRYASDLAAAGVSALADRPPFYRLADLRLRGLLHLLRDDPRVQTFVERELGSLLASEPGTSLLDVLAAYLAAGGNKAEAARNSHLARPTFYERLRRIERILGTDLGSAESRTSLHVALLALDASR